MNENNNTSVKFKSKKEVNMNKRIKRSDLSKTLFD